MRPFIKMHQHKAIVILHIVLVDFLHVTGCGANLPARHRSRVVKAEHNALDRLLAIRSIPSIRNEAILLTNLQQFRDKGYDGVELRTCS